MKILHFSFALILVLFFFSCTKDTVEEAVDLKKSYFPIEKGLVIEYLVDSIVWNDFSLPVKVDSFKYVVRYKIDTFYYDNTSKITYRYIKSVLHDSLGWQIVHVGSVQSNDAGVEITENNLKLLKLTWPIRSGRSWNINVYNGQAKKEALLTDVDSKKSINNLNFDSCAVVLLEDETTLISINFEQEIYSKNIGLLMKEVTHLETKPTGAIQRGIKYVYNYKNHWKE